MTPVNGPGGENAGNKAKARAFIALAIFLLILATTYLLKPDDLYLYIKAFHVIAVMSWMAGLLYLPRLFIYHSDAPIGSEQSETFKMMERRLLKVIMNPAMMITWLLGLYLAWDIFQFQGGWLHAKIAMVVALTGVHMFFSRAVRDFAADKPRRSTTYWRIWNEVPTVLMIAIVILVIIKPF
ncbi:protoporphyrinogen oxidase HemJ [Aliirhizobium terrae]|uniref:protoporphyrinogen oxidase HemJ n=1 Tax=Terrirhizobium terrae TaxID=2926709 RepID=UPI002575636E|nr:protoporphyrinogen oxidase HemJ [Rhizobium sp. CC-CFT758]WJH41641.1 protoporphyrinogen oxidase HemJ [Rhizobium sp. CC-CFT758]